MATPTVIASAITAVQAATSATTAAIDTTGAQQLLVVVGHGDYGISPTISDSKGNTWTRGARLSSGASTAMVDVWYATGTLVVGTSHTFSLSGPSSEYTINAIALTPSAGGSVTLGSFTTSSDTASPWTSHSYDPDPDEALIIAAIGADLNGLATSGWSDSFTEAAGFWNGNTNWGCGTATRAVNASGGFTTTVTFSGATAANTAWVMVAAYESGGSTPQLLPPDADLVDGAWLASSGSDLYAMLDEASASDTDYVYTETNGGTPADISITSGATPGAGDQFLKYRRRVASSSKLTVGIYDGTTLKESWVDDGATALATVTRTLASGNRLSSLADPRIKLTAEAATTPPSLAWGAVGTTAAGTTSCTPSYPTGIDSNTGAIYCFVWGRSNTANTAPTMPSGWTSLGGLEGGTGTWGVDTGTRRVQVFKKDTVTGTESGTVTVSLTGTTANTLSAAIVRVQKPGGDYTLTETLVTGADASNDTSYSAASSTTLSLQPNDLVLAATAQNIDTGTGSSDALTASGITFGTLTRHVNTARTNGNDHRQILAEALVNSGSGTVTITRSYTISASGSGPTAFLRIRKVAPTEKARVTWVEFSAPEGTGNSYNDSLAESLASTDAPSATSSRGGPVSETLSTTDALSATATEVASIAEAAAATDATPATKSTSSSITDSASVTDAPSGGIVTARDSTESLSATDAASAAQSTSRSISETMSVAEAQAAVQSALKSIGESLSATESIVANTLAQRALAEALVVSELVAAGQSSSAAIAEASAVTDAVDRVLGRSGAVQEALAMSEAVSSFVAFSAAVSEGTSWTEAVAATAVMLRSIAEAIAVVEAGSAGASVVGSVADQLSATETVINTGILVRSVAESLAATDSVTGDSGNQVTLGETLSIADLSTAFMAVIAAVSDAASVVDEPNGGAAQSAALADAAGAADSLTRALARPGAVSEALAASDAPAATSARTAGLGEALGAADAPAAGAARPAALAESATVSDLPAGGAAVPATVVDSVLITDAGSYTWTTGAEVLEQLTASELKSASVAIGALVSELSAWVEAVNGDTGTAKLEEVVIATDLVKMFALSNGEDRVFVVGAELRVREVTAELREIAIEAEDRSRAIESEDREAPVQSENRAYSVTAEVRAINIVKIGAKNG